MKRIVTLSILGLALLPICAANAQNASAVVSNATSDATTRAVTEAVGSATQDALVSGRKTSAAEKSKLRTTAKKRGPVEKVRSK